MQKQVQGVELLLGLKRDPQFGPVLVAGAGGIYTEILQGCGPGPGPREPGAGAGVCSGIKNLPHPAGARGQAGVNLGSPAGT